MLSNSQKEHLTYTAIGQVFTLLVLGIFSYQYIFPGISEIDKLSKNAQENIKSYNSILKEGIGYTGLAKALEGKPESAELIKILQSDPATAQVIIKKPDSEKKNYLDWIKWAIWESDKDKAVLKLEKAKLNSIIPTMSPLSSNIEEDNITLRQYVKYIEGTILKWFNFDSNVIIGMQGITFGTKGSGIPENLGMFDFRLDFKGTNSDIARFISYVNNSWEPKILSASGAIRADNVSIAAMSNPLITMESFSLQEKLDKDNPNKENSGRATLRFYVRWVSKDDIGYLKENLKVRQLKLKTGINENVEFCKKDTIWCASYNKKLAIFSQKYLEYERSVGWVKSTLSGNDEIYTLAQSVSTLKSLEKEFEDIIPKSKNK
jgi:hypothetical protein